MHSSGGTMHVKGWSENSFSFQNLKFYQKSKRMGFIIYICFMFLPNLVGWFLL